MTSMDLRKYRWSKAYESAEEELIELLAIKHIDAERHSLDAGETLALHMCALDARLWCAEGSVALTINGKLLSMQPGDTLDIPAYTARSAVIGLGGCVYYQFPAEKLNPAIPAN